MNNNWDTHYKKQKSLLTYPDENLVRILQRYIKTYNSQTQITAVDLGCGSGRHLKLLSEIGVQNIFGLDYSINALQICRENYNFPLIQCNNSAIPLQDNSIDLIITWGSLHYNHKNEFHEMVNEIYRVLKPGGSLFATLRSYRDSYLKKGKELENNIWITDLNDLKGSIVSFFKEEELTFYFKIFSQLNYGIMERSIIGNINEIISHWILIAVK